MKKILSICMLGLLIILVACDPVNDEKPTIEDVKINLELKLNNEERGIDFIIDIEMEEVLDDLDDVEVVLYYKLNATTEDLDNHLQLPGSNKLQTNDVKQNEVVLSLREVTYSYTDDYVSAYAEISFKYHNESYNFGIEEILTTNLYQLALLSSGEFADEILDSVNQGVELPEIELTLTSALNNEFRGFDLNSMMTSSEQVDNTSGVYGFIYIINYDGILTTSTTGVTVVDVENFTSLAVSNEFEYQFKHTEFDYLSDRIYVRSYMTIEVAGNTYTTYSDTLDFNLYELAQVSTGAFADEIIEAVEYQAPDDTEIKHLAIVIDTKNYTVTSKPDSVSATVSTNYIKVTVVITLEEGFVWANNISFKFNGKTMSKSSFTISGNTLTYQFDDPNWSGIY